MKKYTYEKLINKLDNYIDIDLGPKSVSPTLGSGGGKTSPDPLFITGDMDVEALSYGELLLAHGLLHKFHASGGAKNLNKKTIKRLHAEVANKIDHVDFDKLDR